MALVEIIVSAREVEGLQSTSRFDVLAIQPAGTKWGKGSLTGNIMFCVDLNLPCGNDFMIKKRCSACEHSGIQWDIFPPEVGTIGHPKNTCPVQKFMSADVDFEFGFDKRGFPIIKNILHHKHGGKIDYSVLLSPSTTLKIEAEIPSKEFISDIELIVRLSNARNNPIDAKCLVRK